MNRWYSERAASCGGRKLVESAVLLLMQIPRRRFAAIYWDWEREWKQVELHVVSQTASLLIIQDINHIKYKTLRIQDQ